MKGIIIAGGLGTRLRPVTYHRPKPLVPVANRPFLEYQVALLKQHGIDDLVFATNYMADKIEGHFGDGTRFGVRMRYAIEETPLGTGGAIRNAADRFPGETVAVFNGDVLTDFDLGRVLSFHHRKQAVATITLSEVPSPNPFGVLILDADGKVQSWNEPSEEKKKLLSQGSFEITGTDKINAGFYVFAPEFIESIPQGVPSSVERDIFPRFLAQSAGIYGIAPGGFWMDMGRPEQMMIASQAILSGSLQTFTHGIAVGENSVVAPDAALTGHSSVGNGCKVGAGSKLDATILLDGVTIGKGVRLRGVIVDAGAVIEDDCTVEGSAGGPTLVLAAGTVLKQGTRLLF